MEYGFSCIRWVIVWIWLKRGREKPGHEWIGWTLLRERLLRLLHAVDQEQLSQVEQQFELERSEISARLDRLEMSLTQQGRLENWATEVNGRLSQLELSQNPIGRSRLLILEPQSRFSALASE